MLDHPIIEGGTKKEPLNMGTALDFSTIETGLRELNADISLDAIVRRPGDYGNALTMQPVDPNINRSGVYYNGRYVCAIDRGAIPEFKIWNEVLGFETIRMADIEKYDDTKVIYIQILPTDPFYNDALLLAQRGDDHYTAEFDGESKTLRPGGKLYRYEATRETKVRGKVLRVGWRHTFEKLIGYGIPGVTRDSLAAKFNVNLNKFPVGPPIELEKMMNEE